MGEVFTLLLFLHRELGSRAFDFVTMMRGDRILGHRHRQCFQMANELVGLIIRNPRRRVRSETAGNGGGDFLQPVPLTAMTATCGKPAFKHFLTLPTSWSMVVVTEISHAIF